MPGIFRLFYYFVISIHYVNSCILLICTNVYSYPRQLLYFLILLLFRFSFPFSFSVPLPLSMHTHTYIREVNLGFQQYKGKGGTT